MSPFEILEHTADVGVRAIGDTLEEVFEQATLGLLDISGTYVPGDGERVHIDVSATDIGGVLVDWLEEVLYLQDARDAVIGSVRVDRVSDTDASGVATVSPRAGELEGTAVKAITYHQLSVGQSSDGKWVAVVYLDI